MNARNDGGEHLHCAAFSEEQKLFNPLLERGIKVDTRYAAKQTILHFAAQGGQTEMIQELVTEGKKLLQPRD